MPKLRHNLGLESKIKILSGNQRLLFPATPPLKNVKKVKLANFLSNMHLWPISEKRAKMCETLTTVTGKPENYPRVRRASELHLIIERSYKNPLSSIKINWATGTTFRNKTDTPQSNDK